MNQFIDRLCINTIRTLSIDAIQKAGSGHPGLPLGAAPMAYVLWQRHLRHNPADPGWPDRDRFILSAGHGSMLLYSLLHLTGYDLALDDIRKFRQWGSRTPGHPEAGAVPGVEATTGPLGQGAANAVGMAVAERFLAKLFNRPGHTIVDHYTYALVSDGDLLEGIAQEAGSLAGRLKLGRLIYMYDANEVTLDGPAALIFDAAEIGKRYEAYGWQVLEVEDGDHDLTAIDGAITEAKADAARPSIIIVKTTIGYGSPHKAGKADCHGSPLGEEEVALTKEALEWPPEPFHIPEDAIGHFHSALKRGRRAQEEWQGGFDEWAGTFPELAGMWRLAHSGRLPEGWDGDLPQWKPGDDQATRTSSGAVLNAIAGRVPWLIGGDADLSVSTKTAIRDGGNFEGQGGSGRNIRYGIREHAMAAIANGMAYHGGLRTFTGTFLSFCDYMRPAMRMAALSNLPVVYVFTHDSIGVGEDGPTHQPVEQLMAMRVMPNVTVIRPADANETAWAWRFAMAEAKGPVVLVLSRQKLPVIDRETCAAADGLLRGAYVLADPPDRAPRAILIATGSEVSLALAAREELAGEGIETRIVSMPSWELFEAQDEAYRRAVLPPSVKARVSIEAGVTLGWERFIGEAGISIGVDRFGRSAPNSVVMEKFGFTAAHVIEAVREVLSR